MDRLRSVFLRGWFLLPLFAALLACRANFGFDFAVDAQFLIVENHYLDGWDKLWPNLRHDYFWSTSGNFIPYWRPLTKASWWLEVNALGRKPIVFHSVQIAWFLVAVGGVARLGRELGLQRRWALAAATLFALHPAVAEPVSLISARSDVVATACTVWALAMFLAHRRTGSARALVAHVTFAIFALASKESALAIAPLVTLSITRRQWRSVLPAWLLVIAYLLARRWAIGGTGVELTFDPLRILVGGGRALIVLPQLGATTDLRSIPRAEAATAWSIAASGIGWAFLAAVAWCERRRPMLSAWIVATVLFFALPASMWIPAATGKIPLADRWLLPAVVAAALVAAALAQRWLRGRAVLAAQVIFAGWTLVAVAWASPVRAAYRNNDTMLALAERAYQDTPPQFRTGQDECNAHDRRIASALIRRELARAVALDDERQRQCDATVISLINRLSALTGLGRFEEARPTADALLRRTDFEPRQRAPASFLAGIIALETGDAPRAVELLANAARFGERSCALSFHRARAAMAVGNKLDAARHLEAAYECGRARGKP